MQCRIGGYTFALDPGRRYLASRPMATRRGELFTISISDITQGFTFQNVAATVPRLTYEEANALLAEFNNEAISFAGRYIPTDDPAGPEPDTWPELELYEPIPAELEHRTRAITQ
jgi:hypothetical protein